MFVRMRKSEKSMSFKGLKKLKNDKDRFENALKSYITTSFGRFSNADINSIYKKLESLLA